MADKLVVITGGSKGIGRATGILFAKNGYKVAICARNMASLEAAAADMRNAGSPEVFARPVDIRVKSQIYEFAREVTSGIGTPDVLINNAGIFKPGAMYDEDDAIFEMSMETNLNGTYYMCKAFIPFMQKNKAGHVINVCSTASLIAYENGGSYCISKHAQYGLTKVLREEMKPFGIRVTAVLPGATRTESWDGTELPDERFIAPEDMAATIYHAHSLPANVDLEEVIVRPFKGDIE